MTKISAKCKSCLKTYYQQRYVQHREHLLHNSKLWSRQNKNPRRLTPNERLIKKYNITIEEKAKLLQAQDGVCSICRSAFPSEQMNKAVVDHCHTQGHIRGILCRRCNCLLGFAQDNPEILQSAINYLKKPK